jgi:hypothetical protein
MYRGRGRDGRPWRERRPSRNWRHDVAKPTIEKGMSRAVNRSRFPNTPIFPSQSELKREIIMNHFSSFPRHVAKGAVIAALAVSALLPGLAYAAKPPPVPSVPSNLVVTDGSVPHLLGHAVGTQNYTCQLTASGTYAWTFVAPAATLSDDKGKQIATHYAGPTWQATDGSTVVGQVHDPRTRRWRSPHRHDRHPADQHHWWARTREWLWCDDPRCRERCPLHRGLRLLQLRRLADPSTKRRTSRQGRKRSCIVSVSVD